TAKAVFSTVFLIKCFVQEVIAEDTIGGILVEDGIYTGNRLFCISSTDGDRQRTKVTWLNTHAQWFDLLFQGMVVKVFYHPYNLTVPSPLRELLSNDIRRFAVTQCSYQGFIHYHSLGTVGTHIRRKSTSRYQFYNVLLNEIVVYEIGVNITCLHFPVLQFHLGISRVLCISGNSGRKRHALHTWQARHLSSDLLPF